MLRLDGALCLTFVNAGLGRRSALESYDHLLAWSVATGAFAAADASRLERAAAERPGGASGTLRRTKTLRARLERILADVADDREPRAGDLEALNLEIGAALSRRRLAAGGDGFRWAWDAGEAADLDRVLWPVVLSAGELLVSDDRRRIRQCSSEGCGLWFVARGGGRPRKWCEPACRDRGTSRKHYQEVIRPRRERLASRKRARQKARLAGWHEPPESSKT